MGRVWREMTGYVMISVEGKAVEVFLNRASELAIPLWHLRRVSGAVEAKTDLKGFRRLRPVARATHCRVRLLDKQGVPFTLRWLLRRWMLAAGAVMFAVAIWLAASIIWWIDVDIALQDGVMDQPREPSMIQQRVEDTLGQWVWSGMWRSDIQHSALETALMNEIPDLAWVSVQVEGVRLTVRGVEALPKPQMLQTNPADLVASRAGVVERIQVLEGSAQVKPGDSVVAGQLLISHETADGSAHARGTVWVRCFLQERHTVPLYEEIRQKTGKSYTRQWLEVRTSAGTWVFPGTLPQPDFSQWDVTRSEIPVPGDGFYIPMVRVTERFEEVTVRREIRDEAIVAELAFKEARQKLAEQWRGEAAQSGQAQKGTVTQEYCNWWRVGDYIQGEVSWEVLADVAITP